MVHPKIEEAYREAGLDYQEDTEDLIEMKFKDAIKDRNNKIPETSKKINAIYRTRVEGNKEYLLYFVTEFQQDHLGNRHDWTHLVGKYKHPIFSQSYNQQTGRPQASGVLDKEVRYEIPFSPAKVEEILAQATEPSDLKLYVSTPYARFSGYSLDELKYKTFFELEQKGVTGKYPRQEEVDRQQQQQQQPLEPPGILAGIPADLVPAYQQVIDKNVDKPATTSITPEQQYQQSLQEEEETQDRKQEQQKQQLERRKRTAAAAAARRKATAAAAAGATATQ